MENNNTKNGKKRKKEGIKKFGRIRTQHLRLDATTPNHYTRESDYVVFRKSLLFYSFSMKLPPAR